jgi:hypothetical protein
MLYREKKEREKKMHSKVSNKKSLNAKPTLLTKCRIFG